MLIVSSGFITTLIDDEELELELALNDELDIEMTDEEIDLLDELTDDLLVVGVVPTITNRDELDN